MDVVEISTPAIFQPVLARHRTGTASKQSSYQQIKKGPSNQLQKKTKNYSVQQMVPSEKNSPLKQIKKSIKTKFINPHQNHKINQVIGLANEFLQETFLRTNDQPVNVDRVKYIC